IGVFQLGPFRQISSADYAFTDIYFLSNGGATSLAVMTSAGPVLLDAKLPGWGAAVMAGVRQVTEMPVAAIVATNAGGDHAGAIAESPPPVQVLMHETTANRLKGRAGKGTIKTFRDKTTLTVGDVTLLVYNFGKGNSDGDAFVVVPSERTAYAGDLV